MLQYYFISYYCFNLVIIIYLLPLDTKVYCLFLKYYIVVNDNQLKKIK